MRQPAGLLNKNLWRNAAVQRSLTIVLLLNLFVLGLIAFVLFEYHQQEREKAVLAADNLSRVIDENLSNFIDKVDLTLLSVIDEIERAEQNNSLNSASAATIINTFEVRLPLASAIRIANAEGRIVHALTNISTDNRDVSDREYFLRQRDDPNTGLFISRPFIGRLSGQLIFVLSRRRKAPANSFAGIVSVVVTVDAMSAYLASLDLGPRGAVSLWDDQAGLFARFPPLHPATKPLPSKVFQTVLRNYRGPTEYLAVSGVDGVERQFFVRKLNRWPIFLNVGLADADLLAGWRRAAGSMGFLATLFLMGSLLAAINIVKRRQDELVLHRNEERFRLAMEATSDGLWDWDLESDEAYFSPGYFRILGHEPGDFPMTAESWTSRVHADDLQGAIATNQDCIENRCDSFAVEFRMRAKDGTWKWILGRGRAVARGPQGRALRMIGTHLDITERKRTEDQLKAALAAAEDAARAKSLFLAMMSHEIRTPLSGVVGIADLMRDGDLSAGQVEQVETIRTSAQALLAVIDNILDLTKLDAGRIELFAAPFDLRQVLADVLLILRPRAVERGLDLTVEPGDELTAPFRLGDAARIRQVLINLVGNAIKFTETGRVAIRLIRDGDNRIRFEVHDTGIGFDDLKKRHLFEAFTQADPTISRRYGGSGLGLAVCLRLVALMGGQIDAESVPGDGSVFHFALDLPACQPLVAVAAPVPPGRRPLELLLAEDNPVNAAVIEALLRKIGHRVTVVRTGAEAVKAVATRHVDLVLMDMQMPDMDGLTATRVIRAMEGSVASIPVIGITANAFPEDRERCLAAGMNIHLSKPVTLATLSTAIDSLSLAQNDQSNNTLSIGW